MTTPTSREEPGRIDEPQEGREFSEILSRVVDSGRPIIVRRDGKDYAAVVPAEQLELFREFLARQEAEELAKRIDWERAGRSSPPPQQWFDGDEPKPF